ncbi:stepping stone [Rhodnius prolixus]
MVASLQSKKEVLETKLKDKTSELRKLCLEEAELTGVLPPETPLEPGESPPQFRRRIATAYTFPENLINKLKSKEDETLAALELECKIQTGIAEAALGLASDGTASKSVRRKHRVLYEETQNRLHELQNRLSSLKQQSQPKLKKKPRPQTEIDDCVERDDGEEAGDNLSHPGGLHSSLPERAAHPPMRHSQTYCGYPRLDQHSLPYHQRIVHSHMTLPGIDNRHSMLISELSHGVRSNNPSPIENAAWWPKGREVWHHQMNNNVHYNRSSPDHFYIDAGHNYDRFGSLDRNSQSMMIDSVTDSRLSATLPRNIVGVVGQTNSTVLLPGQTYPENSLMRTQSLGSVESSNKPLVIPLDRKSREKEWYESSLDSTPMSPNGGKNILGSNKSDSASLKSDEIMKSSSSTSTIYEHEHESAKTNQASINNIQFDTVVPYESPKNHTVVQAGKWQPYREVTKPFEMSDFYKYSTKFRQFKIQVQADPKVSEQPTVQQKAIYKPLQPLECRPLMTNCENRSNKNILQSNCVLPYNSYSTWYHETNVQSKPRPSTLV